MLYDPKWEAKANPLSLVSLIAWLEQQQPEQTYDKSDPDRCMFTQFCKSIGAEPPLTLHGIHAEIAFTSPQTMGAALDRARSIAAR